MRPRCRTRAADRQELLQLSLRPRDDDTTCSPYLLPHNYYLQTGLDSSATLCYDNKALHLLVRLSLSDGGNALTREGKDRTYAARSEQQASQETHPRP